MPCLDRVHDADHQWLQALSLLFAGAGSRDLGARQQGRDGAGVGWPRRSRNAPGNRIGEPAANPYLYMASADPVGAGWRRPRTRSGPSADTPYETQASLLPRHWREAVSALQDDGFFREAFGSGFVDYYVHIKNAEIERFQAKSPEWNSANISRCLKRRVMRKSAAHSSGDGVSFPECS